MILVLLWVYKYQYQLCIALMRLVTSWGSSVIGIDNKITNQLNLWLTSKDGIVQWEAVCLKKSFLKHKKIMSDKVELLTHSTADDFYRMQAVIWIDNNFNNFKLWQKVSWLRPDTLLFTLITFPHLCNLYFTINQEIAFRTLKNMFLTLEPTSIWYPSHGSLVEQHWINC